MDKAGQPFRNDPFETRPAGVPKQSLALMTLDMAAKPEALVRLAVQESGKISPPVLEGLRKRRMAV